MKLKFFDEFLVKTFDKFSFLKKIVAILKIFCYWIPRVCLYTFLFLYNSCCASFMCLACQILFICFSQFFEKKMNFFFEKKLSPRWNPIFREICIVSIATLGRQLLGQPGFFHYLKNDRFFVQLFHSEWTHTCALVGVSPAFLVAIIDWSIPNME